MAQKVIIGSFARASIESRLGEDLEGSVNAALVHYGRRLRAPRKPIEAPRFIDDVDGSTRGVELELELDAETEDAMRRETERQGVSIEQLVAHAVFIYLSDLEKPPLADDASRA